MKSRSLISHYGVHSAAQTGRPNLQFNIFSLDSLLKYAVPYSRLESFLHILLGIIRNKSSDLLEHANRCGNTVYKTEFVRLHWRHSVFFILKNESFPAKQMLYRLCCMVDQIWWSFSAFIVSLVLMMDQRSQTPQTMTEPPPAITDTHCCTFDHDWEQTSVNSTSISWRSRCICQVTAGFFSCFLRTRL